MKKKTFSALIAIKLICCGAIIIIILGGAGLISGITMRNIVLLFIGSGMLIYGLYVYFKRRGMR